jgi:hypothetical protein
MLSSIHPLGERARHNRWWLTVTAFVVGASIGGAVMGGISGFMGQTLSDRLDPSAAFVGAAAVVVVLAVLALDLGVLGLTTPTVRRQVDENWLNRYRGWVYGVGYGFQLGLGFVTVVSTAAVYGTAALALLSGSTGAGALIGATFGFVRGLAVVPGRMVTTPSRLRDFHRRLDQRRTVAARLTPAVEVLLAASLLTIMVMG